MNKVRTFCQDYGAIVYDPNRDGSLITYYNTREALGAIPLFTGMEQYRLFIELQLFLIHISCIRLMYNVGRGDGIYGVTDDYNLEGVHTGFHNGEKGVFTPEQIFTADCPPFEVHHLNCRVLYPEYEVE